MSMNDPRVYGPFDRLTFMGGTVYNFAVNQSWGDQSTVLNIDIVEDPSNDDFFIAQDGELDYDNGGLVGTPFQLTYGGFTWGGLLKSVNKNINIGANPTYSVSLISPVEVLDAVQVVLASYVGPNSDILFGGSQQNTATFKVSNLINIYGWAENGGQDFGRSLITDTGMPWTGQYGIQAGLEFLTNIEDIGVADNNYGSYIRYKGNLYKLDLSSLPIPPSYYRVGGVVNMTLLDLLTRFFEDAGVNWMIKLVVNTDNPKGPHTIGFVTVPRYIQQPLGKILEYITQQQNLSDISYGQELRSDITQAFLVGGSLNLLQTIQNNGVNLNILPFWGFDVNGSPIIGSKSDGSQFADDDLQMNLNSTSVADIMGELGFGTSYPCSILEMRCALGNYDTWAAFIQLVKPQLADKLQLYGTWDINNLINAEHIVDILNDNANFVNSLNSIFQGNHWPAVCQRLYEFVRGQAEVYYGKKFIVLLPFDIKIFIDPQTAAIKTSNELSDAGYAPEGEQILGLSQINESYFLDQTGRFNPFVQFIFYSLFNGVGYQRTLSPNISYLKGTSTVVQFNQNPQFSYIYSRCEQGDESPVFQNGLVAGGSPIFFIKNQLGISVPAMVISLPDAVWGQADDITGSIKDLSVMMNIPEDILRNIANLRSTSFSLQLHPPAYYPAGVAVALKSNQELYGPWGKYTTDGKLNFEQDEGLVPWEYGDLNTLNLAAIAKLNTIATGNQVLERGNFTESGLPTASPGDQLVEEGPILTSISCSINTSQVTTNYVMETFVNRIGAFSLENADRLRKIGKIYQQLRRTIRQQVITQLQQTNLMLSNYNGFLNGTSYAVEQHSPHAVLGARLYANNSGTYTPFSWTQTYQESLANLGLNSTANFQATACVGMEALLRPYSTNPFNDFLSITPQMDEIYKVTTLTNGVSGQFSLNPLQNGCDINWLLSGDEYSSLRTSKGLTDFGNARSLALRGPIMVSSWGFDLQGNPVPNSGAIIDLSGQGQTVDFLTPLSGCNDKFIPQYLQMSNQWPTAPLDLVYDKFRSVWASPGMILEGINSGTVAGLQGSQMALYIGNEPTTELISYNNFLGGAIPTGVRMQVGWNPLNRTWTAISVACSN